MSTVQWIIVIVVSFGTGAAGAGVVRVVADGGDAMVPLAENLVAERGQGRHNYWALRS